MSSTETTGPQPTNIHRRRFMQMVGAGAVAAAGGSHFAVQEAEAIGPLAVGAAVVGGAAAAGTVGWALREAEILGSDDPPEGLTPETLEQTLYDSITSRISYNESTFVDNRNIIENLDHVAYSDGKIAAIEALNEEQTQAEVLEAARSAARDHIATVQENLIGSWNEMLNEFESSLQTVEDHPDLDTEYRVQAGSYGGGSLLFEPEDYELVNGETTEIIRLYDEWTLNTIPDSEEYYLRYDFDGRNYLDKGQVYLIRGSDWNPIWNDILDVENQVVSGLEDWVTTVYDEVQAGEIDTADLLTPREQAEMLSDEEDTPQAVADLMALNMPVDADREATVKLLESETTLSGFLQVTSVPEGGLVAGQTVDASQTDWDAYLTYDVNEGEMIWTEYEPELTNREFQINSEPPENTEWDIQTTTGDVVLTSDAFEESEMGDFWSVDLSEHIEQTVEDWDAYEEGVDGGDVTFTDLPTVAGSEFVIETTDGQTTTLFQNEFSDNGDGTYTAETDLGITEIESVEATIDKSEIEADPVVTADPDSDGPDFATIELTGEFEIVKIEDSDGEEADSLNFTQQETHDDSNYITQEEWEQRQEAYDEQIEKYEDALESDSDLSVPGLPSLSDFEQTAQLAGLAIIAAVVLSVVSLVTDLLPGLGD